MSKRSAVEILRNELKPLSNDLRGILSAQPLVEKCNDEIREKDDVGDATMDSGSTPLLVNGTRSRSVISLHDARAAPTETPLYKASSYTNQLDHNKLDHSQQNSLTNPNSTFEITKAVAYIYSEDKQSDHETNATLQAIINDTDGNAESPPSGAVSQDETTPTSFNDVLLQVEEVST